MSGPFGGGSTSKLDYINLGRNEMESIDDWISTGTNDTAAQAVDATYGTHMTITLGGADNDEGSLVLDRGAVFHPVSGDKFDVEGLVKLTEAATNNIDFGFGFFDALEDTFSDTAATLVTTTDHLLVCKFAESLFWRGAFGNDSTQVQSGATTTAMASGTWYRLRITGEVQTDGLHARFYVDEKVIYTIGYGSTVSPQSVTGFTGMYFGVTIKATNTNAEVAAFLPIKCEINQSGV